MTQCKNNLINKAINEIETIVNKYSELEILYSVTTKDDRPDDTYSYVSNFVNGKKDSRDAKSVTNLTKKRMTIVNTESKSLLGKIENEKLWL